MSVPFHLQSVPKNGTKPTARHSRAHKENGTSCRAVFCAVLPAECAVSPIRFAQPVNIHGVQCLMTQAAGGGYVISDPDGRQLARESSRLLAVARAAVLLANARAEIDSCAYARMRTLRAPAERAQAGAR